ncbi:hypothetical protein CLOM_g10860 [Closterium sp. NIES-68]|nr:hypothetical protein CLOM_g10860 [Closterium sp. NIES-68]GJP74817.1 hypothetical protein CLOP_g5351 [Closterium sp. NIES-67]
MDPVRLFSETFSVDYSVAAYLVGALSSVPVAYLHRFIRSPALRHVYAAVSGVLLSLISFTPDVLLHFVLAAAFTLVAMRTQRSICGLVTFIGTFAHLIACHVIFMSDDARRTGRVDFTGTLTIVAIKLTSLAMDYQDGLKALKEEAKRAKDGEAINGEAINGEAINGEAINGEAINGEAINGERPTGEKAEGEKAEGARSAAAARKAAEKRARVIKGMPSAGEFLGYLFCCGQHLLGPWFDYQAYDEWTNRRGVWSPAVRAPSLIPPFLRVLLQGALAAAVFLLIAPLLDLTLATDPVLFFALPFARRVLLVFHATLVTRWRCYIVWSIAEAAMVAGGLGFSGWVAAPKAAAAPAPAAAAASAATCADTTAADGTAAPPAAPPTAAAATAAAAACDTSKEGAAGEDAADEHEGKENHNRSGEVAEAAKSGDRAMMGEVVNNQRAGTVLSHANGAAVTGEEKKRVALWDRARNVNILGMELASTGADVAKNWNISFSTWLRIYVYERLESASKKNALFNLLFTFFISAISHGLNPGDLIGFGHWALMIAGSRVIYRWTKPLPKGSLALRAASVLHFLYVLFCINYAGFGFSVMTFQHTMQAYRGLCYYGTILPLAIIMAGNFIRAPRPRGSKKSIKTE